MSTALKYRAKHNVSQRRASAGVINSRRFQPTVRIGYVSGTHRTMDIAPHWIPTPTP